MSGFRKHKEDDHAWAATEEALQVYREHASGPGGRVALLAASAAQGDPTVAPAFAALITELLASLRA